MPRRQVLQHEHQDADGKQRAANHQDGGWQVAHGTLARPGTTGDLRARVQIDARLAWRQAIIVMKGFPTLPQNRSRIPIRLHAPARHAQRRRTVSETAKFRINGRVGALAA